MEDFKRLFNAFSSLKVGVIGDVMLDTYMWGKVDRISPEAPVPVVTLEDKEYRIGGAGNVALNCKSLGAEVSILSITGDDTEGLILEELFEGSNIDTTYLAKSKQRVTTSKTRILSRNQQMLRVDHEATNDLSQEEENHLLQRVQSYIAKADPNIIIFEDYNKGILTERLISQIIPICRAAGVLTAVDPKQKNFFAYQYADIFKPNLKEVKDGLNILFDSIDKSLLESIHHKLEQIIHHHISFITLSEKGVFYQQDKTGAIIPSHRRNVADVSGAGDTVIAVASMVYAVTRNTHLMAEIANIAGGMVCEVVGTAAIDKEQLLHECELLLS